MTDRMQHQDMVVVDTDESLDDKQILLEMREWLIDCEVPARCMTPSEIRGMVDRSYQGGIKGFIQDTIIEKTVRVGSSRTPGGRWFSTYISIRYDGRRPPMFGVEGPTPGGNAIGSCGQINPDVERLAPGWTWVMLDSLAHYWEDWHLNDMRSTTGNTWEYEQVPSGVLEFLGSLPDTDRIPAWI